MKLNSSITEINPPARFIPKLEKLGIKTVEDLLCHFPHRYENFGELKNISDVHPNEKAMIQGQILKVEIKRTPRKRMQIVEADVQDETGTIKAVWFNQAFLRNTLRPGVYVSLSGKIDFGSGGRNYQIVSPIFEIIPKELISPPLPEGPCVARGFAGSELPAENYEQTALVPVYPETEGLTSRWLRIKIKSILHLADELPELIPEKILNRQALMGIAEAVKQAHFPENEKSRDEARRRLAFEELFLMQVYLKKQRKNWQKNTAEKIKFDQTLIKHFVGNLPFKLTVAQRKTAFQILQDIEKPYPMNRLLEGDVGSGKTVVAAIAMLQTASAGFQSALMAPTEVLAEQHFKTVCKLLPLISVGLLTNSYSKISTYKPETRNPKPETVVGIGCANPPENMNKNKLIEKVSSGEIKIIIGTHSLIQKDVIFKNLALAIVDEQHRFGVNQRAALQKKAAGIKDETPAIVPHLLTMTATPIPRTLALSAYGDLDISIIDEMPKGRQKIITRVVAPANRDAAYNFVKEEIKKGRQVFVVCPLISESETMEVRSVEQEYEKLSQGIFKEFKIGMMHGKLKPKEKEEVMEKFKNRRIDIMISTSVVEVGIDIPNASVMIIEGSERFGLAQLHQFRGRVGRGEHQSYCLLFTDSTARTTHQRLKALANCSNGFELAQKDLEIRGPGEFIGRRQSGLPDLVMANLNDLEFVQLARAEAEAVVDKLDGFEELRKRVEGFEEEVHFE